MQCVCEASFTFEKEKVELGNDRRGNERWNEKKIDILPLLQFIGFSFLFQL
jgi:hypothetical protein